MEHSSKFRILAFDPGLTTTGWSYLEGDTNSGELVILKIGEIHPGPTVDKVAYRDEVAYYDKRTISLSYLREQVTKLLIELKPDVVSAEDIYINPHRPMAYGALCMVICVLRMLCRDLMRKYLVTIPTKICKQVTTGSGANGKLTVQQAIAAHKRVHFRDPGDLQRMSEHEADSIAVGLAMAERYKDLIIKEVERRNEQCKGN